MECPPPVKQLLLLLQGPRSPGLVTPATGRHSSVPACQSLYFVPTKAHSAIHCDTEIALHAPSGRVISYPARRCSLCSRQRMVTLPSRPRHGLDIHGRLLLQSQANLGILGIPKPVTTVSRAPCAQLRPRHCPALSSACISLGKITPIPYSQRRDQWQATSLPHQRHRVRNVEAAPSNSTPSKLGECQASTRTGRTCASRPKASITTRVCSVNSRARLVLMLS